MAAHVSVVSTIARSDLYQPARALPINVSPPTLSGTPRVGSAVTCSTGAWLNFPISFSYQWYKDGAIVFGATTNSYTPTASEGTHSLFCRVTPINAFGAASSVDTATAVIDIDVAPLRTFKVSATDPAATYATIAQVNAATFLPGDAILFKGGETFSGGPIIVPSSGDSSHRLTVGSYGGGKATITTTGEGVRGVDKTYVDVRDLIITGPGIAASKTDTTGTGVRFEHSANSVAAGGPRILNNEISAFPWNGILVHGTRGTGKGFDGTQVSYNTVTNCCGGAVTGTNVDKGSGGIMFWGRYPFATFGANHTNVVVERNTVTNCTGVSGNNGAAASGSGIYLAECGAGCVARYNHVGSCGGSGTGNVGIWFFDSEDGSLQHNTVYNQQNASGGNDGSGMGLDYSTRRCTVEDNYVTGCYGPGFYAFTFDWADGSGPFEDGLFRYNIAERNCTDAGSYNKGEFMFYNGSDSRGMSCNFHNNIAYTDRTNRVCFTNFNAGPCTGYVANNIFAVGSAAAAFYVWASGPDGIDGGGTKATFVNNCYSGETTNGTPVIYGSSSYASIAAWLAAATTQERISSVVVSHTEAARITGGALAGQVTEWVASAFARYQLSSGSPIADAGRDVTAAPISLPSNGTADFFGNTIPVGSGYAIGVHDRSAASTASEALVTTTYSVSATWVGAGTPYTGHSASGGAGLRDGTDNAANSIWATYPPDDGVNNPYIIADCGSSKILTKIVIRAVGGGFDGWVALHSYGAKVETSIDGTSWTFAGYTPLMATGSDYTLPLGSVTGRYVRLSKTGASSLAYATFKVFGY